MKILVLTIVFLSLGLLTKAQSLKQRLQTIEDKIALKELVDQFSNLADTKNVSEQVLLFTKDAVVEIYMNKNLTSTLKGRKELENAFAPFLKRFDLVYHSNGQQNISINGNTAKGTSYCTVTLINKATDKIMKTTFLMRYEDEFIKEDNKWYIAKRKSIFDRNETIEVLN